MARSEVSILRAERCAELMLRLFPCLGRPSEELPVSRGTFGPPRLVRWPPLSQPRPTARRSLLCGRRVRLSCFYRQVSPYSTLRRPPVRPQCTVSAKLETQTRHNRPSPCRGRSRRFLALRRTAVLVLSNSSSPSRGAYQSTAACVIRLPCSIHFT